MSLRIAPARRRAIRLQVLNLEERVTPAAGDWFAPVEPPVMVIVAEAPTHQVLASDTSVRADLFGVGDTTLHVDELEEMLLNEETMRRDVEPEPVTPQQDSTAEDTEGVVVIEDTLFLPCAE